MGKVFIVPMLKKHGTIVEMTGTECIDLGLSDEKDFGYPSDTNYKFIPICDPEDGGIS